MKAPHAACSSIKGYGINKYASIIYHKFMGIARCYNIYGPLMQINEYGTEGYMVSIYK